MAAITLALVGTFSHTSNHDAQFDAGSSVVAPVKKKITPTRPRTHDPAVHNRPPVSRAEARLQSSLSKALKQSGAQTGALVFDLDSQSELYGL